MTHAYTSSLPSTAIELRQQQRREPSPSEYGEIEVTDSVECFMSSPGNLPSRDGTFQPVSHGQIYVRLPVFLPDQSASW